MSIKEYKYSIANKWNSDATGEIIRACKFLIKQIKKGWEVENAYHQVENQYGYLVAKAVMESFGRVLTK